ncbi:homocysteine S-methyltransferase family protein [Oscillatoria sp. FACHB-1407]|uniref:homocysteine S-methyltransferase family protein n=1 Tax=Oscillatoria sp. FACHB-1407 TaxID=2692847 RepID=UPI0016886DA9|nr:homocysteine S-methyltransferase family protein [Oscillatoria sp. FACHB-1407]MBD2461380.1 homocysteine S-methyltransferase family protein [Oscillatoria sp. FACHB-1407]
MAQYRHHLPQLSNDIFLTDGGLETTLIFLEGLNLPDFAAFDLLRHPAGYQSLQKYFRTYANLAQTYQVGLILESATWRASSDWGTKLGYSPAILAEMNRRAIALLHSIRQEYETEQCRIVISGCVGPRGDGYVPAEVMTVNAAENYHRNQIAIFRDADADLVTAITMNYVQEAIGITRAAQSLGMPVVISFTVETNGKLPTGQPLSEAIAQVDAATDSGPAYYMINCAHPTHFADVLADGGSWLERIRGIRANASVKSHAELNESDTLDEGNPEEFGSQYRELRQQFPHFTVLGGCCGTDDRHIKAICQACLPVLGSHLLSGKRLINSEPIYFMPSANYSNPA